MGGVERLPRFKVKMRGHDHSLVARDFFPHPAIGIDEGCQAVIGGSQQVSVILNRAQAGHFQVLIGG